jgi:ATP-dependent Clp protease, protease subunit
MNKKQINPRLQPKEDTTDISESENLFPPHLLASALEKIKSSRTETPEIDLEKNQPTSYIIFLTGEINQELADKVSAELLIYDLQNKAKGQEIPITLLINSPGGELHAGWQICDIMDYISTPVYTTGLGEIASAALIVFMNGAQDHRIITDRTTIMSHRYSWGVSGNHVELIAAQSEFKNIHEKIVTHYIECTGLARKTIESELLKPHDVWLTAKDAIKYGMADHIFKTKKTKDIRKKKRANS